MRVPVIDAGGFGTFQRLIRRVSFSSAAAAALLLVSDTLRGVRHLAERLSQQRLGQTLGIINFRSLISINSDSYQNSWRRGRDSNPRYGCPYAAFRVRCIQPLCHLSIRGRVRGNPRGGSGVFSEGFRLKQASSRPERRGRDARPLSIAGLFPVLSVGKARIAEPRADR